MTDTMPTGPDISFTENHAGNQILKAHPYEPPEVERCVPGVFDHCGERLFLGPEVESIFVLLHAVHGVELRRHLEIVQFDQLAVALDDKVKFARLVPGEERPDVGVDEHAPPVDLVKLVIHLKSLLGLQRAAVEEAGDLRGRKARDRGVENGQHEQAGQKIHCRPGDEDDRPLPPRLCP